MKTSQITHYLLKRYLLRHPQAQRLRRYQSLAKLKWLKAHLEHIKPQVLPNAPEAVNAVDETMPPPVAPTSAGVAAAGLVPFPTGYPQYHCHTGAPLNCVQAHQAVQAEAGVTVCPACGFPAPLAPASIVVGDQGQYRVEQSLGQRNLGRQYQATFVGADIPVTLREYLLPKRYFTLAEQQQRRDRFLTRIGMTLADGRSQDLRVILPTAAIAPVGEERVYLLLPAEAQAPSLNDRLVGRSPLSDRDVQKVLLQVLQTLVGLHQQKYTLSPGRIQTGVVHGNIQLSSLLWIERGADWFIYLTDFADWENAFHPQMIDEAYPLPQADLKALGQVAFRLLTGTLADDAGQPLNPRLAHHWPSVYPPLQHLILRLLGIEPAFVDARAAYQALCKLPPRPVEQQWAPPAEVVPARRRPWWHYVTYGLVVLGLAMLGWRLLWSILQPRPLEAQTTPPACCFDAVGAVPEGRFTYTATTGDVWEELLEMTAFDPAETGPLMVELAKDQPKLELTYQSSDSVAEALEKVRSRQVDFAFVPLLEPLPPDMAAEVVAYDGLAVVVAFNYQGRTQGLPDRLQGQLPLSTLQALYREEIDTWHEVNRALDLPVALYANGSPTTQAAMEHLLGAADDPDRKILAPTTMATIPMLRRIIRDFEAAGVGSIGVAPLSAIEGQCSVYPLAIQGSDRPASQPFQHVEGASLQPSVDLCRTKSLYQIEAPALQTQAYPLAYPLAIVYRYDNRIPPIGRKFAELLHSDEGQHYLQQVDLVGVE